MASEPIPLFQELVVINRRFMQENCGRLEWHMVACWESEVSRVGNDIRLHQTSIWVTPDRSPRGMMVMKFGPPTDGLLGAGLNSESITSATNQQGDCRFVLGFANDDYVANCAVDEYVSAGTHTAIASVAYRPEGHPRTRSARSGKKSRSRKATSYSLCRL